VHVVPVEAICSLKDNPIQERVDLSAVTTLEVDAGWRTPQQTAEFLQLLRKQFDDLGYGHIDLKPIHKLRRGMIIIDGVIYKVNTQRSDNSESVRFMHGLKCILKPILEWCEANCTSKFILDENGLQFASDDDFILFKMKFSLKDV
jgi:hypothetical protein